MFWRRSDLALDANPAHRYLPWLVAVIVYLAGLSLAGVMSLTSTADRWDTGLKGTVTVQVPARAAEGEVERVLSILRRSPGVTAAKLLGEGDIAALLEPWLGDSGIDAALPLPRLIDVQIDPAAAPGLPNLAAQLAAAVPGTELDDHRTALDRIITLVHSVRVVAFLVLILVSLVCLTMVIFITRTGLAIHQDGIELLHLMGAMDGYVARQFLGQALKLGLTGGTIGLVLTAATVAILGHVAAIAGDSLLPRFELTLWQWTALAGVPIGVTMIAMVTAHFTALYTLRRMP